MIKNVLIAGGSGFVGSTLKKSLESLGYKVFILTRNPKADSDFFWDTNNLFIDPKAFENADCLINLSGESISKPWTKKYKEKIISSRVQALRTIEKNISPNTKLQLFISASACGIYGNRGEEIITESSNLGSGFLAKTSILWENAFNEIELSNTRKVSLRISNVMDKKGGMLNRLMQLSKLGILSPIGSGKQIISWVDINDLCSMIECIIKNDSISGIVNACNNFPISNTELVGALNKYNDRLTLFPHVPAFILGLVLGARKSLVLDGQRVVPEVLNKANFSCKINSIEQTLNR